MSFRFTVEAVKQLRVLSELCGMSQVKIIEALLDEEYQSQVKKDAAGVRKAEAVLKAASK